VASCCHHRGAIGPEREKSLALPRWLIGWDVFCWLGHRRLARHWSVPQLRWELRDTYRIRLSDDAIEDYLQRYQCMVAARQRDFARPEAEYAARRPVTLSIDGLQPEKGHETLYVVRELGRERVWFAMPLLSSAPEEIRPLIVQAASWAERLGCRVRMWISGKQEAFVTAIASVCPGVPHRYCGNHFLRDVAKPMLELDSHAKVQMRRKIRGLRAIERDALKERKGSPPGPDRDPTLPAGRDVILDYCAAVRGILNDGQGGPLRPPSLRMSAALGDVRRSLLRNLRLKKGAATNRGWNACWLHRPGSESGGGDAATGAGLRRVDSGGERDARPHDRRASAAEAVVRRVASSRAGGSGSGRPADGPRDGEFRSGAVRRRRCVRCAPR
jgi:hypothetical protein